MHREAITGIIRTMEGFGRELAELSESASPDDRARLVTLRRRYSELSHDIGDAVEKAFIAMGDAERAELQTAFRSKTANIRKATAEHQARFPAITIADDPAAYGTSAHQVSDLQQDLLLWLKTQLLPRLQR